MAFKKATKEQSRLRLALIGPAGSGKTYTALNIAKYLGKRIAVLDTERGSASKYADKFEFDVCEPPTFAPAMYVDTIHEAEAAGYDVLIIDSLSHAWNGKGGALEMVDNAQKRSQSNSSFAAWRDVTPQHNALVDTMLSSSMHIIATLRAKMEYVQEKDEKTGHTKIRKVGLQPVQREGLEYEFDVIGDLTTDNNLLIGKTRCSDLTNMVFNKPGKEVADILNAWLTDGDAPQLQIIPDMTQEDEEYQGVRSTFFDLLRILSVKGSDLKDIVRKNRNGTKSFEEFTTAQLTAMCDEFNKYEERLQPTDFPDDSFIKSINSVLAEK